MEDSKEQSKGVDANDNDATEDDVEHAAKPDSLLSIGGNMIDLKLCPPSPSLATRSLPSSILGTVGGWPMNAQMQPQQQQHIPMPYSGHDLIVDDTGCLTYIDSASTVSPSTKAKAFDALCEVLVDLGLLSAIPTNVLDTAEALRLLRDVTNHQEHYLDMYKNQVQAMMLCYMYAHSPGLYPQTLADTASNIMTSWETAGLPGTIDLRNGTYTIDTGHDSVSYELKFNCKWVAKQSTETPLVFNFTAIAGISRAV